MSTEFKSSLPSITADSLKSRGYDIAKVEQWLDDGGTLLGLFPNSPDTPETLRLKGCPGIVVPRRTLYTLHDLETDPELTRRPEKIGETMTWRGRLTLFYGREKLGKSHITTAEVSSILYQGLKVLWISSDECLNDITRRSVNQLKHKIGGVDYSGKPVNKNLFILHYPDSTEEMSKYIKEIAPDVIIVDSLSSVFGRMKQGNFDVGEGEKWHNLINAWRDYAIIFNCAILIIHHEAKGTGESRGSTGITAAVDMIVQLCSVKQMYTDKKGIDKVSKDAEGNDTLVPNLRKLKLKGRIEVDSNEVIYAYTNEDEGTSLQADGILETIAVNFLRTFLAGCPNRSALPSACIEAGRDQKVWRSAIYKAKTILGIPNAHKGHPWVLPEQINTEIGDEFNV